MAKIKLKKVVEYKTMVPRPADQAPKGEYIGKQFQLKPVEKVKMGKNGKK
jgi:hypothetical protein